MQAIKNQLFNSCIYRLYSTGAAYQVHRAEYDETDDGFDVQDLKVGVSDSPFL